MKLENESEKPKCTEKRRREPVVAAGSGEDKGKLYRVFGPWEFFSHPEAFLFLGLVFL